MNGTWSLETLVWMPLFFVLLGLTIFGIVKAKAFVARERAKKEAGKPSYEVDYGESKVAFWGLIVIAVGLVLGTAIGMYPYSAEYHQWREDTGTVTSIDSRFTAATQRVVVTLDDNRQRSCDDTRCAEVQVGDVLTLSCKRAWQYTGTDGYDCNYVGRTR